MEQTEKRSIIRCQFPGEKGYKDFYGLDLDYVLSYSDDLPFKYHTLKAEFIVRISKEASIQKFPDEMKAGTEDMESLDDESEEDVEEFPCEKKVKPIAAPNKGAKNASKASNIPPKITAVKEIDDLMLSDTAKDSEIDENGEVSTFKQFKYHNIQFSNI
jgi:hypothetical protein